MSWPTSMSNPIIASILVPSRCLQWANSTTTIGNRAARIHPTCTLSTVTYSSLLRHYSSLLDGNGRIARLSQRCPWLDWRTAHSALSTACFQNSRTAAELLPDLRTAERRNGRNRLADLVSRLPRSRNDKANMLTASVFEKDAFWATTPSKSQS